MGLRNGDNSFGSVSKFFHWSVSALVLIMLSVGFFLSSLPESFQGTAYMLHKSTGLLILTLMIVRAAWAAFNPRPLPVKTLSALERLLSRVVQDLLFVFVILMPLSGWAMATAAGRAPSFYQLFTLPMPWISESRALAQLLAEWHERIAWILIGLLVAHIGAAMKHHHMNKDEVLKRMLPGA